MSSGARLNLLFGRGTMDAIGHEQQQQHTPSSEAGSLYEPSVLLIVAGGTICMQDSTSGLVTSKLFLDECLSPKPTFNDGTPCPTTALIDEHGVRRDAPSLRLPRDRNGAHVRCTVLEFNPLLDSSTAHAPTWNQLARTVRANEEAFDAFVICHGTDTMAYTAAALSFMLMAPASSTAASRLSKTVILTGAQRSMFFADSDGSDNLLGSIVLASHVRIPEVCVYFGHKLLRGTRITKVSASNYAGFESPNAGPLASVSETGIVVHWDNLATSADPHPAPAEGPASPFPSSHALLLHPRAAPLPQLDSRSVIVLKIYPGITPDLVATLVLAPATRGVVLETFGAGNIPTTILPVLRRAIDARSIVIVNVSQCLHGAVSTAYAPARQLADVGVIAGGDMTTEAAYTKLVWVLAAADAAAAAHAPAQTPPPAIDVPAVKALMSRNLCGEVTEPRGDSDRIGRTVAMLPIRYERTVHGPVAARGARRESRL